MQPERPDGTVLLQIGVTIVALALALATIVGDKGPHIQDFYFIPAVLLVIGLIALFASLLAMAGIWVGAGMRMDVDLFFAGAAAHPEEWRYVYYAIVASTWSLWSVAVIYFVLLYTRAS